MIALLVAMAMVIPAMPVLGAPDEEPGAAGPRAITDNSNDLIVPDGETYDLSGVHTYKRTVQINGTLKVLPYDGSDPSGTLSLSAPWIIVGPNGKILADGRGYGGGGGGSNDGTNVAGGKAGTGGKGGDGQQGYWYGPASWAGGGGGGSFGGMAGSGGSGAQDGRDTQGGNGAAASYGGQGGNGGSGFGGGGGGGGGWYAGGGGGGGGGTGGKDSPSTEGGAGGGPFKGAAGPSAGYSNPSSTNYGGNGGYMAAGANGDTTTDASLTMGSGGGGGGSSQDGSYGGGAGGGGAGGGAIALVSTGDITVHGAVTATGGGGGVGGTCPQGSGGSGGGGAGGGILIQGIKTTISGTVDARGRQTNTLSATNGGTVKLLFGIDAGMGGSIQGGRIYKNGRPVMGDLISPAKDGSALLRPTFTWEDARDPENDKVTYQIQVSATSTFGTTIIDEDNLHSESYTSPSDLVGTEFYWRVRAADAAGWGAWSETWRFLTDITPPQSKVEALPAYTAAADFSVTWSGTDDSSGIGTYTIMVAEGNQTFKPWLTDTPLTTALYPGKDGRKYAFYSMAMDRAQNREAAHPTADTFTTVDTSPPVSGFVGLAPYQSSKRFDVFWGGKDAGSGIAYYDVYYADNKGEFSLWLQQVERTSSQFEGKEFHTYSFYTIATDKVGNVEASPGPERIFKTMVDLSTPRTTLTTGDPKYGESPTYITSLTPMYLAGADSGSGLNETLYSVDGRPPKVFRDQLFETVPGAHNMIYWSVDLAGNKEPDNAFQFYVDTDMPISTISFGGANFTSGDRVYISTATQIEIISFDRSSGLASVEYNLDSRGFVAYSKPFKFDKSGFHTIVYRGVDRVGNTEADKTVKVMVDSSPPVTKVKPSASTSRTTLAISLNATDMESGVSAVYFRISRGTATPGDYIAGTEAVIEALDDHSLDGNYTLQYYSVDLVGNAEPARTIKYKIDTVATLDTGISGEPSVSESTFVIQGKVEPGAKLTINGVPVLVAADGMFTHQLDLSSGRNKVEFSVTDAAGNTVTKTSYVKYNPPLVESGTILPIILLVVVAVAICVGAFMLLRRGRAKPATAPAPDQRLAAPPPVPPPVPPPK